jgi:hypothetical protein
MPLLPTLARLAEEGISLTAETTTPHWHGERLDLGWAIDVLRGDEPLPARPVHVSAETSPSREAPEEEGSLALEAGGDGP